MAHTVYAGWSTVEVWYTQCTQIQVWLEYGTHSVQLYTVYTGMSWEPDVGKGDALTLATGLSLYWCDYHEGGGGDDHDGDGGDEGDGDVDGDGYDEDIVWR